MIPLVVVPPVNDRELLARAVVSNTEAKACRRGDVPASVFTYHGQHEISVDRFDRMAPDEAVQHGKVIAWLRGSNRRFQGWALLTRPEVVDQECSCRASPRRDNFWHADILMPVDAAVDRGLHEDRASRLARHSTWREIS